jgi:hypothetical protein
LFVSSCEIPRKPITLSFQGNLSILCQENSRLFPDAMDRASARTCFIKFYSKFHGKPTSILVYKQENPHSLLRNVVFTHYFMAIHHKD